MKEELKTAEEALQQGTKLHNKMLQFTINVNLVPEEENKVGEEFPEMRRVKDRKSTLDIQLREQKELFLLIFQVQKQSLVL